MIRTIPVVAAMLLVQGCGLFVNAVASDTASPALRYMLPSDVVETSGLAAVDGLLWTMNDSGNDPVLYGLAPDTGRIVREVTLSNARNRDWEDLAQDSRNLYIADTGNNRGRRKTLTLYKVPLKKLGRSGEVKVKALKLRYNDYKAQTRYGSKAHNVDCEAMAQVNDKLWLFTKNRGDQRTRLYKAEINSSKIQQLAPQSEFDIDGLVTAADYNPDTRELAILTYGNGPAFGQAHIWRVPVVDDLPDWANAQRYSLVRAAQWEAILWKDRRTLILSAEGSFFGRAQLAEFRL